MLDVLLDHIKKLLKSRLFPIALIYLALFFVIIRQLFVLQIVEGPTIVEKNVLRDTKTRELKSTRGNFYDRNGKLLASNVLTYSVMMEDSIKIKNNAQRNEIIHKLIQIIEKNGDTLDNEFYIRQNKSGKLEFTIDGAALTRFKKKVYAFVLDDKGQLKEEQVNATAEQVYEFLRNGTGNAYTRMFEISDSYTVEETLKIMSVRYALHINYPKYLQISVASDISDKTIAAVEENSDELPGVEIVQQTHRVYQDSIYFAHILGYTGLINAEELEDYEIKYPGYYNSTDIVGKKGLEKKYEELLRGTKGSEIVSVNVSDKIIETIDRSDPVAGCDIYLTIDSDLQRNTYHLLEKELAKILLENITPDMDYGSKGESATDILIPIYEVYFALINNNIIDFDQFNASDASELEQRVYMKYQAELKDVFSELDRLLSMDNTIVNNKAGDMEEYLDAFYSILINQDILLSDKIPSDDKMLLDYKNDNISLSKFLQYAIASNWVDISKLGIDNDEFSIAEELYNKLITHTKEILKQDDKFNKKIYHDLVFSYKLSGTEICLLLFDQDVLKYNEEDVSALENNRISAYDFITDKIKKIEITPAMLALEPCSGSVVITDVDTGNVMAMVTYPGYDNNLFANRINTKYYNKVHSDLSLPWMNRPVEQLMAPGSTFKMVTSFAALEEGVTSPEETILDLGEFTEVSPPAKCHIYPRSHGSVNIVDAIKVSCNYYFYEMGWRLSVDGSGNLNQQLGLSRLQEYATLFGLNETSGVELYEAKPHISDEDAIRSSIGQGSHSYTPVQLSRYVTTLANKGTCFDLTLLDKIVDKDGQVILDNQARVNHDLTSASETTWNTVLAGMYAVANENKGSVASTFKNFGVTVAGKTGTSQINTFHSNNALFLSFAPYEAPEISVTTVIPNGYTSHYAADLSKDIYALYFDLEDEEQLVESEVALSDTNIDPYLE